METLSGYRHVFTPQDPQASQNPVNWSHLRLSIGGRPTSILSRIAAYGVDYSGRTNKLAHHVVLEPGETAAAGPAWLLARQSLMRTAWDNVCETPPAGPAIAAADQPPAVCQHWQSVTGDAGWGGVVAEAIASGTGKPLWIIFSIQQSAGLLSLINEAIALLPVSQRWQATFSTYYTNLPPEIDCKLRCVLVGTDEAKLAAARGSVIDLTKALGPAPASQFVRAARTGESDEGCTVVTTDAAVATAPGLITLPSARDAIETAAGHEKVQVPGLECYSAHPPIPTASPPPIRGVQRKNQKKSVYAALISAAVLILATAVWALTQQEPERTQLLAEANHTNDIPQQRESEQLVEAAAGQADSNELRELEILGATIEAECQQQSLDIQNVVAKIEKLRSSVAKESENVRAAAKQMEDELGQIKSTQETLKQHATQVEEAKAKFVQDRNRREAEMSVDPQKADAAVIHTSDHEMTESIKLAKMQADKLPEPSLPDSFANEVELIRTGLKEVSKRLREIESKNLISESRTTLEARADFPITQERRRQLKKILDTHDAELANAKQLLTSVNTDAGKIPELAAIKWHAPQNLNQRL